MITRRSTITLTALVALACLAFAPDANATPNFPDEIAAHLMLQGSPACAICHQGGNTGVGTVTTPFGKSMRARGLVPFDLGSLDKALDLMASGKVDSLGDGTPDIDDLKAGRDPNVPDGDGGANVHVETPIVPAYGCGNHVAPSSDADPLGALAALAASAALVASRLRRRR